jgi:hypothetical protein
MYLIFRSTTGERFDMGTLIMLGVEDGQNDTGTKPYVISEIRKWTPEERWERFFGENGEAKCVVFRYGNNVISAGYIKLPHYEGEIFCFVDSEEHTFQEIEEAAIKKYYGCGTEPL